jgi:hypothetical protein
LGEAIKQSVLRRAGLALKRQNVLCNASVLGGYIAVKQSWMMGLQNVCKKFEGGRSWLIVLHHHCRNPHRLWTVFTP